MTLKLNWRKSLLTIIGIAIGVSAVIIISTISSIGTQAVSSELKGLGLGGLLISHKDPTIPMSEKEIRFLQKSPEVRYVMPLNAVVSAYTIESGFGSAIVFGVDEGVGNIISLRILNGRGVLSRDLKQRTQTCIIDTALARRMFGTENGIGEKIPLYFNGNSIDFTVIGVAESGTGLLQNIAGAYMPAFIYVPYTTLQQICGFLPNQQIVLQLNNPNSENIEKRINTLLSQYTGKKNEYNIQSLAQQQESLFNLMDIITTLLTMIGGISLLVACLNIMTTMLVSVRERTREIGIKKSIGAENHMILREFMMEAIIISISGSLLGIMCGIGLSVSASILFKFAANISWQTCLVAFFAAIIFGFIFSVYPAYRAAKMNPIDALRFD